VPLLEVREISKSFAGFRALSEVTLAVEDKSFCALVGPNGAGKSTLFNIITGRVHPTSGSVQFGGRDITNVATHRVVRDGIGISFQRAMPFQTMTVLDNLTLGVLALEGRTRNSWRRLHSYREAMARADEVLSWVGLSELRGRMVSELPQGDLKRLDIALALAGRPKLLLLDEPLAGLSRAERAAMVAFIRELLRKLGVTLLFTEHDTAAVMHLADRITVLNRGKVLAEGTADEIRNNPQVIEAFLGREE
jgi:branched-chain amino acid transport system ATP-binding protein